MTGSPTASVFEEILSETVHFRMEPAGTSCSADATVGTARRRRENVSRSLLFMGDPGDLLGLNLRSPAAVAPATKRRSSNECAGSHRSSRWKPIAKNSTIMRSLYLSVNV